MAEKKVQKTKVQSDYLSDSDTSEEVVDPQLHTSEEERIYGMIKGSTQARQAVLSHTRAQSNLTVERGPPSIGYIGLQLRNCTTILNFINFLYWLIVVVTY